MKKEAQTKIKIFSGLGLVIGLAWAICLCGMRAGAAVHVPVTYFVATNGSDANSGLGAGAPFRTIQHAGATAVAGDTVYISGGVYHETLGPSNSGITGEPITFAAYSNHVATLDAADAVTGWTYLSNGIYHASVNWDLGEGFDQVFVDGVMIHEAQYPNYGSNDVMHPPTVSVTIAGANSNVITSAAWSGYPSNYWAGAWFRGGVSPAWAWQTGRVLSSAGSNITVSPSTETSSWWFTNSGSGLLWGSLSFLNADNEWYAQTNAGGATLYLRITGGANPTGHVVEMKHRNWCVNLLNRNYVTVSNLSLTAGAVLLQGNGNALLNCQAQFLSHYMIITNGNTENGGSTQGGGVVIDGASNIVSGCTMFNTAGTGVYSGGSGNVIKRNLIYNTDYSGTYASCISLHGSGEFVIFNTTYSTGRDILLAAGTDSVICFNDMYNCGLMCLDDGIVYARGINAQGASGSATRIAYNWISGNCLTNPYCGPLIYLDNYDRNFVVDHNVCWGTAGDSGIRVNGPTVGTEIYNNTVFNCGNIGINTYNSTNNNPDPAFWTNNVYQYSASNNLYLSNSPETQLVNWTNDNFSLLSNAPAINAGVVLPGFTDGYSGPAPDLGAYELGSPPWNAGVGSNPTLTISSAGGGRLTLTASPDAIYYVLYTKTNSSPSARWYVVTNTPYMSRDQWYLTLTPPAHETSLYRLQAP